MAELTRPDEIRAALAESRSVAVLGASSVSWRAGFYVGDYLHTVGYAVFPVNPSRIGEVIWGRPTVGALGDLAEPMDLIDVFRRPDQLPAHVDEILALPWRPRVVWFQQGIVHQPSADRLVAAGIDVVQDRCTYVDHRQLGVSSIR